MMRELGSIQSLDEIAKLELWHDDTGVGHGWFADYVAVIDNKTGEESCFFIGEYLNKENGGVEEKHIILDKQIVDNRPCREHQFDGNESTIEDIVGTENPPTAFKQTYRIETKTGITKYLKNFKFCFDLCYEILITFIGHTGLLGLGGSGTSAPVFIRIHDNNDNMSEPIQLKNSLNYKNKFQRNQTGKRILINVFHFNS
jgi:hypothetical protein